MKNKTRTIVTAAVIAAAYASLTLVFSFMSYGPVQFRIAEMLTVLPYYSPAAVAGLTVGCLLANIFSPYSWLDVIFGTAATALGAAGTYFLGRKKTRLTFWLAPLPTVISNAVVVGGLLTFEELGRFAAGIFAYNAFTVAVGELTCCYALGIPLMYITERHKNKIGIFN